CRLEAALTPLDRSGRRRRWGRSGLLDNRRRWRRSRRRDIGRRRRAGKTELAAKRDAERAGLAKEHAIELVRPVRRKRRQAEVPRRSALGAAALKEGVERDLIDVFVGEVLTPQLDPPAVVGSVDSDAAVED